MPSHFPSTKYLGVDAWRGAWRRDVRIYSDFTLLILRYMFEVKNLFSYFYFGNIKTIRQFWLVVGHSVIYFCVEGNSIYNQSKLCDDCLL